MSAGPGGTPQAEVSVSPDLVRRLIADQHPDLADLPVVVLASGWDNLMCRLGTDLAVRLPRRTLGARLLANELRWLPVLAPHLPLPVPAPIRTGTPALGYPWSWAVVPFLPGDTAAHTPPADPTDAARALGAFAGALHRPADSQAPVNAVRGVPLVERADAVRDRLDVLADVVDTAAVTDVWQSAMAARPWDGPPCWLHGDLHPANILVDGGRISAVIDFGDLTSGDPATDLAAAWMLLPLDCHDAFRSAYAAAGDRPVDDETWLRASGWAVVMSLALLAHSADNPIMARIGRTTLDAVLDR